MQPHTHIICECGNDVEVFSDLADAEYRCMRCGRRIEANEDDFQHLLEDALPPVPAGGSQAGSRVQSQIRSHAAFVPAADPDATAVHPTALHDESSIGPEASAKPTEHFEVNDPNKKQSSAVQNPESSSSGSMHGSKYDLSKRVMRPITKPVTPIIPYSGTEQFGIHRILRLHQKGGMGRILVAYDPFLKREVAAKDLHPEVADDDNVVRRFIGEAEITAQLEHPGVVPIYQLGQQGADGLPYYTMKMIKGETLQDLIKTYHRKPTLVEMRNLVRRLVSVSKTIAFAHSKGVIHRDLKPANVMVGEYGETLVMDWGLAKPYHDWVEETFDTIVHQTHPAREELTMAGSIVGTPAFMSPEQAMADDKVVGPLSDVFSLGTLLYYLLAGQTAFSGRSTQEVLNKVRACKPTPPSRIKPNVPHGLEAICLKAMEKLPENRYQGASEFADDLCRWLDDEPVLAEKPSLATKLQRWVMRHHLLLISILCTMLLSVALTCAGWWWMTQN